MHGHVDDVAAGHLDVADVLVEEGLEDDDLVAGLDEGHEGAQHALVGARGDGDLGFRVELPPPERGVGLGEGLPQAWAALGGRVLVAFDAVEGLLGGVEDEVWRVVAEEALAHVDDGLPGRGGSGLVDDGPGAC